MALARAGAKSRMALIEESFEVCNLRPFVRRELLILMDEQKIEPRFRVEVTAITPTEVHLRSLADGSEERLPNDFVFTLIGQSADVKFSKPPALLSIPKTRSRFTTKKRLRPMSPASTSSAASPATSTLSMAAPARFKSFSTLPN